MPAVPQLLMARSEARRERGCGCGCALTHPRVGRGQHSHISVDMGPVPLWSYSKLFMVLHRGTPKVGKEATEEKKVNSEGSTENMTSSMSGYISPSASVKEKAQVTALEAGQYPKREFQSFPDKALMNTL
ncbi:hypothetical protein EK904_001279 [Melospiza melodia maxima]|nr:hypothetical protein EK904_001279 [Melospiza melodia maxima]